MLKNIIRYSFLIAIAGSMVACTDAPLTEAECTTIEHAYINMWEGMPGRMSGEMVKIAKWRLKDHVDMCKAGQTYVREDYECINEANGAEEVKQCFRQAKERYEDKHS